MTWQATKGRAMKGWACIVALAAVSSVVVLASGHAAACTLEDDPTLSRDTLNHYFPDALGVLARVVEARRANGLPPAPGLSPTPLHIQRQMTILARLDRQMRASAGDRRSGPVAVLLIESMLWARLPAQPSAAPPDLHATGPADGDIVMVTSEDAIARIVAGETTLAQAKTEGWMRLYGPDIALTSFVDSMGGTGRTPAAALVRAPWRP